MSRAEEITSEVRKLVLTCRTLEAQLQQSISKKAHQEVVSKMQAQIDGVTQELARTKDELEKTVSVGDRLNTLTTQVASQNETMSAQNKVIDSLTERLAQNTVPSLLYSQSLSRIQELEEKIQCMVEKSDYAAVEKRCAELNEELNSSVPKSEYATLQAEFTNYVPKTQFEELRNRISEMVPKSDYESSQVRISELETRLAEAVPKSQFDQVQNKLSTMVPRSELVASQIRIQELESRLAESVPKSQYEEAQRIISEMVPKNDYISAQARIHELETTLGDTVPKSQYEEAQLRLLSTVPCESYYGAQARISELEARLAASVPRADYEELTAKIASLTREAAALLSGEAVTIIETRASDASQTTLSVPQTAAAEATAPLHKEATASIAAPEEAAPIPSLETTLPKPEITEIQAQLSNINGATETGATTFTPKVVDATHGFNFANTEFYAKSGIEFLEDVEKVPVETIEAHTRNGDFERWFKDVLADETSAESLRTIRESNCLGEELRARTIQVIAPRYRN